MKKLVLVLTTLLALAFVAQAEIVQYPIANDYYAWGDTLTVVASEDTFDIGDSNGLYGCYVINRSANELFVRAVQGDSTSAHLYCGPWGTLPLLPHLLMGPAMDQLLITATDTSTVYIVGWEVK